MRFLSFIIIVFILISVGYSVAVPIFEAPDELQHYATTEYMARFKWFPPLGKPTEHLWDQETLQAPLYYMITGALTSWVDTSDFSSNASLQPKTNFGDAELPGKKNSFLHPFSQSFPYHGVTLAVHIARWFSTLLGAGTIVLTFIIATFIFSSLAEPVRNLLALLSAAFIAFTPQFIFIHSSANNDTMMTFTSTLTLAMLLWIGRDGATTRRAILFGLAVGLMCLSKLTGTVLTLAAFTLFPALIALKTRSLRFTVAQTFIALVAALVVAGWWYVRNQVVYGDPLALTAFLKFVGGSLEMKSMSPDLLWEQFRLLRFSTWGLFGHISLLIEPVWIYTVYDVITLIGVIGFTFGLINALRSSRFRGFLSTYQSLIIVLLWFGAVLVIGARWFFAAGIQGRLIYPGLSAGAVLLVWGFKFLLDRMGGERFYKTFALGLTVPMAIFAGAVVPLYLLPAYSLPPLVTSVPPDLKAQDIVFHDEIKMRGYTSSNDERYFRLKFYWETLKTPTHNYYVAIRLLRPDGSFWLDYGNLPGMGTTFPTTWQPGEIRLDEYVFELKRFTKEEKPMRLIFGFYDRRIFALTPFKNWNDVFDREWALLGEIKIDYK